MSWSTIHVVQASIEVKRLKATKLHMQYLIVYLYNFSLRKMTLPYVKPAHYFLKLPLMSCVYSAQRSYMIQMTVKSVIYIYNYV